MVAFLIRFKWILAHALVLLVIAGIPHMKKAIIPNNELNLWFVENDPALKAYQDFSARYGNDRLVMLLVHDTAGIFQHERIEQINNLTQKVVEVDGVKKVYSLTNLKDLFRVGTNNTMEIKYESPFSVMTTECTESMKEIREQVLASTLFRDHVINKEGTASLILIQLEAFEEIDLKRGRVIDEIEHVARESLHTDDIHMGGLDIYTNELNKLSKHDFGLFMGITYVLMFLLIFVFFRKWAYVLLALATILISVMLTLSIFGFAGKQLNLFSLVVPSLIVILGLINILHIINEFESSFRQNGKSNTQEALLRHAMKKVFRPCLFATLTTMIGFLSLLSSSTVILREFGLLAALGIFIAFISSFVFSALVLQYVSISTSGGEISSRIADQLVRLSRDIQLNTKKYWLGISILCALAVFGITKIKADMFVTEYFPRSNDVIRDHAFISQHWGNYYPIDFLATAGTGYSFKSTTMLKALDEFQKEAKTIPGINSSISIINLIDKASTVFLDKDVEGLLNNPTQTQLFLNNMLEPPETDISNFISDDFQTARITLTGPLLSVSELEEKVNQIMRVSEKHFGDKAKLSVTSFPALYLKIMKYAVDSMIKSLGLAIVLIFITLTILLRNIRLALIAMIPNIFPIFLMFSFMGVAGINLDLATATVATIALGIGVDDTIHILSYYQRERRSCHSCYSEAIIKTQYHIGRIIVISSIVLCAGYLVLLLASIKTMVYFGMLTSVAVSAALIGDIILLPLLLKSSKIKP
jgi:predicted RND superfamily exporter protein